MLQPEEIKKITFEQSVFSGYKKEDVDTFLDTVYAEYSRLYSENAELVEKLQICITKIDEYRQDEKFLKSAIVNAQKLNETAMQEIAVKKKESEEAARRQADEIISAAKAEAESLMQECTQRIATVREKTTAEFAKQQSDNADMFNAQMREYEAKLAVKNAELEHLQKIVGEFKAFAASVYQKQLELLETLPEYVAPEQPIEPTPEPVAEEVPAVETEATVDEQPVTEPEIVEEPIEETEEETNEEATEEIPEQEIAEVPADTEETPEKDVPEEQISIDDMLAAKSSPVEPQAPVVPPVTTLLDDQEEDDGEEFYLFGASPLVFPKDIPDDDDGKKPAPKGRRGKKKLKFGVDFDVKKDK